MAHAYRRGSDIVVSYAGTTNEDMKDWLTGNVPAATAASLAEQVFEAARFYLDVARANPGAAITFTGHSLGGGLAALMAVLFNRPAVAFDEAPFQKSADSGAVIDGLRNRLQALGYKLPDELRDYQASFDLSGAVLSSSTRIARQYQFSSFTRPVRFSHSLEMRRPISWLRCSA